MRILLAAARNDPFNGLFDCRGRREREGAEPSGRFTYQRLVRHSFYGNMFSVTPK
jgi:hypothetical protein